MATARLSEEFLGWARLAGYAWDADTAALTTRLDGLHTELSVRATANGRMELHEEVDGVHRMLLYALNVDAIERHLFAILGDDVRADLDLAFLDLPCDAASLASGYELSDVVRNYRTLTRTGVGPVAAAPDSTSSLLALVPLSHFLGWSIAELKRGFLSPDGAPLLRQGRYAPHPGRAL